jgi:hypothetical protein
MSPSGRLNWLTFNTKAARFASESVRRSLIRLRQVECVRRGSNPQPSAPEADALSS